jgi:uncharacterized protein (TIGR00251 family)
VSSPLSAGRDGSVHLAVHAQPGAKSDGIAGLHGERLKVKVSAPPEDGRANDRIAELLAEAFGVPRRNVLLTSGATSRRKDFVLGGTTLEGARNALQFLLSRAAPARPR